VFDFNGILEALKTDPKARGTAATGAAAGLATGLLMGKSGRKMLGKAGKYGAIAALGGLAYHAWQRSQAGKGGPSAAPAPDADYEPVTPEQTAFLPPPDDHDAQHALGQSLLRAMIAAAKADGRIDADENRLIFERMESLNLDAECKAFVVDSQGDTPQAIRNAAEGCPTHAIQVMSEPSE